MAYPQSYFPGVINEDLAKKIKKELVEVLRRQSNYVSDDNWFYPSDLNAFFQVMGGIKRYDANKVLYSMWNIQAGQPGCLPLKAPMPGTTDVYGWSIRTTRAFSYPIAHFYLQLPDLSGIPSGYVCNHFGFEIMHGTNSGLIDFLYGSDGTDQGQLTINVFGGSYVSNSSDPYYPGINGCGGNINLNPLLQKLFGNAPWNGYVQFDLKLDRDSAWFFINTFASGLTTWLLGVVLLTQQYYLNNVIIEPPPYAILIGNASPEFNHTPMLIELDTNNLPIDLSKYWCWFPYYPTVTDGDPKPPRALFLYQTGTTNTFAGLSVSSGSVTSHPIPVYGYGKFTIGLLANNGFTAEVQTMGLNGNWITYDTYSTSSGNLVITIDDPMLLARVILTPSTYPTTIQEGFVVMQP
jgi:hypothetical protein